MKLYFVLILIFACIPDGNLPRFAAVYAGMLPITALAYDERSRWNTFNASLPCSKLQLVLSKYLLGAIALCTVALLSVIARYVYSIFDIMSFDSEFLVSTAATFIVALFIEIFLLPLMFFLGVEKGRLYFMIITVVIIISSVSLIDAIGVSAVLSANLLPVFLVALAALLVVAAVSVLISAKVYKYSR